jgi:hypothetical protein
VAEEVVIEIDQRGDVTVNVNGVVGTGCTGLTKAIEDGLGVTKKRTLKPEHAQAVSRPRPVGR